MPSFPGPGSLWDVAQPGAQRLRDRGLRATPQRLTILAAFDGAHESHLSADEVHARAVALTPTLGRGTVYATLAELSDHGLLAAVGHAEPVRYELNTQPHQHFRCDLCQQLFDVDLGSPQTDALTRAGHTVHRTAVIAEGVCADCHSYGRGLHEGCASMLDREYVTARALAGLACQSLDTAYGTVALGASARGVVRLAFEDHADFSAISGRARRRGRNGEANRHLDLAVRAIADFLAGKQERSAVEIDWAATDRDAAASLEATRDIPYGDRRSYRDLQRAQAPYACGFAIGTNPVPFLLPCHRVTRGQHRTEDYVGGLDRRTHLDTFERDTRRTARRTA